MADGFYEFYRMDKKQLLLYQDNCLSLIDKFRGEHWYSFMLKQIRNSNEDKFKRYFE